MKFDFEKIKTPAYIIDEKLLIKNLETLKYVMDKTGCKILLAQKGFSSFYFYPLISKYLSGTTASGVYEAKLGYSEFKHSEFGKEVHVYSPAYTDEEMNEIIEICDVIVFNSFNQINKFKDKVRKSKRDIKIVLRVNPEYAEVEHEIYNPCGAYSRFGEKAKALQNNSDLLGEIDGLHFHSMCEQGVDVLERTLKVFETNFKEFIPQMKFINFGGGHHITKGDYDVEKLIHLINDFQARYKVSVYLEPGEAVVLNTGFLVSKVIEIFNNEMDIAILDASAACHMPDILEMPYRAEIINGFQKDEKEFNYRLAGATCLAGDIIGDYSFAEKLKVGDYLTFCDMSHYTIVKNNTFNGMPLPSIYSKNLDGEIILVKEFSYEDFKNRLS